MATTIKKLEAHCYLSDIFEALRHYENAIFLDSSMRGNTGKYSVVGINPFLILEEKNGTCYQNGIEQKAPFLSLLHEYLEIRKEPNTTSLPLISGALGYLTYDMGRSFEKVISRHEAVFDMPDALMCFYDTLIIEDHENKELYLAAQGELQTPKEAFFQIAQIVSSLLPVQTPTKLTDPASFVPNFSKTDYQQALRRMISYMEAGDIYVANMTQQLVTDCPRDPYEVYRYLRHYNPAPFSAYLNGGGYQICCASMERFMQLRDGRVETRPIKGTRKRGSTPNEDEALRHELEASEKDRSELLMVVDLERNDLSRVCMPGSVRVIKHCDVEAYATVFHLVTTIEGRLEENKTALDLIEAAFPGGSITGAPKVRAMQIIDELEQGRRGIYTGSIGYVSCSGDCDLNVVIRTALCQSGKCHIGVGGGITYESDVEFEYEETMQKAKALLEAIGQGVTKAK